MKRIIWTGSQLRTIATYLFKNGVRTPDDRNYLTMVREAQQKTLSEEYHRPITTKSAIKTLEPVLADLVKELSIVESKPEEETIPQPIVESLDDLVQRLADAAALNFAIALKQSLSRIITDGTSDIHHIIAGTKPKRKKILIAGLLPQQAGMISSEYGQRFDLRFFESNDNLSILRSKMQVDMVVSLTGKISHSIDEVLAKHENHVRISGLMAGVRKLLDNLA